MSAKLLRIELRRNLAWWALPLLLAGGGFLGWSDFRNPVMLWPDSVLLIRDVALFGGPLIGGVVAFVAGRDRRRGIEELVGTTPRPELSRRLTTWTATLGWGMCAYVLVGAALLIVTYLRATWGGPEPWPLLVGVLSVLAQGSLGYAAGHYLKSWLTAPLAAIGLFAAQIAPYLFFRESWPQFLSPSSDLLINSSVWYGIQPDGIGPPQALFLFGIAAVGLAIFAVRVRRSILSWGVLASGVLITAAGVATVAQAAPSPTGPIPRYGIVDYEPVCEEGRITVCVHPAYGPMLNETAAVTQRMSEPLEGLPAVPDQAQQTPFNGGVPGTEQQDGVIGFELQNYSSGAKIFASDMAGELVREPESEPAPGARNAMGIWLLRRAGVEVECSENSAGVSANFGSYSIIRSTSSCEAADRFAALDSEKRQRWLKENYADLRAGELTLEELP